MRIEVRPLILEKLKQRTCIHHERASKNIDILHAHLSMEEYGNVTETVGFYKPLGVPIANGKEWPLSILNFDRRKKIPLLEYDLYVLGYPSFLPLCTDLPELPDFAHVLGCLYVLEGATLGGQIIARHIRKKYRAWTRQLAVPIFAVTALRPTACGIHFAMYLPLMLRVVRLKTRCYKLLMRRLLSSMRGLKRVEHDVTHHTAVLFISFIRKETSMNTASIQESTNLANCEKEPILIPGSIQSHGILIVLQEPDLTILQISSNTMSLLGTPPEALLQQKLTVLLGQAQIEQLKKGLLSPELQLINLLKLHITVQGKGLVFDGSVHRINSLLILEMEPVSTPQGYSYWEILSRIRADHYQATTYW